MTHNTQPRTICKTHGYEASIAGFNAHNGPFLAVTRKAPANADTLTQGRFLSGAEALQWAEALETALDAKEQAALCRAIYQDY